MEQRWWCSWYKEARDKGQESLLNTGQNRARGLTPSWSALPAGLHVLTGLLGGDLIIYGQGYLLYWLYGHDLLDTEAAAKPDTQYTTRHTCLIKSFLA